MIEGSWFNLAIAFGLLTIVNSGVLMILLSRRTKDLDLANRALQLLFKNIKHENDKQIADNDILELKSEHVIEKLPEKTSKTQKNKKKKEQATDIVLRIIHSSPKPTPIDKIYKLSKFTKRQKLYSALDNLRINGKVKNVSRGYWIGVKTNVKK